MLSHIRYIRGKGNFVLYSQIRNADGNYWNFSSKTWDAIVSPATKVYLSELPDSNNISIESTYCKRMELPLDNGLFIHQIVEGTTLEVLGEETLDVGASGSKIIVPALSGAVYSPTVQYGQSIKVVQDDTPTLTGSLNNNFEGFTLTLYFENKPKKLSFSKVAQWSDASKGFFTCDLTSQDTAVPVVFEVNAKAVNPASSTVITALKFKLIVLEGPDV